MNAISAKIDSLTYQLEGLLHAQENHMKEVRKISRELKNLSEEWKFSKEKPAPISPPQPVKEEQDSSVSLPSKPVHKPVNTPPIVPKTPIPSLNSPSISSVQATPQKKSTKNLEAYVGGNLISKIGIALTVLGLGYFLKYAIDRELISPLFRILLALLAGGSLIGIAYRLREKYSGYSGVLFSGGIATLYFSIFGAHDFFGLIPYGLAHILMVGTTVLAVYAAFKYKVEVIAIIGMIGSYAIRFLLNGDYGNPWAFFSFIALINAGILTLAIFRFWRITSYLSFFFTWLIFAVWVGFKATSALVPVGLIFASVSFLTFYGVFLGYKLYHKEELKISDIIYVLLNAAIFFGLGHELIIQLEGGSQYLGLFSVLNALLHAGVAWYIYRTIPTARAIRYLVVGLAWIFITVAIPIQLGKAWVPMLWIMEGIILFAIARYQRIFFYEFLSYIMVVFAGISLAISWGIAPTPYLVFDFSAIHGGYGWQDMAWINKKLLATLVIAMGLGSLTYLHHVRPPQYAQAVYNKRGNLFGWVLPILLLGTVFLGGTWEIVYHPYQAYVDNQHPFTLTLIPILLANFSLILFNIAAGFNLKWFQRSSYGLLIFLLSLFTWITLLTSVGSEFAELRTQYLANPTSVPAFLIWLRYPTTLLLMLSLYLNFQQIKQYENLRPLRQAFTVLVLGIGVYLLSAEILHWGWLRAGQSGEGVELLGKYRRIGLSVLWGSYGLVLMILGFWKKEMILRVFAISLMGATLLKAFFYDMQDISNVNKTINFVALGVVMLIVSYLYQRYKSLILGEEEVE